MKKTASLLTLLIMCLGAAFAQNEPMHGWHTYCASEFADVISYGTHTTVATCYPPEMASNFAGTQITKVAMFSDGPNNSIGGIYTCSIYLGGETPSEGLIAYTMSCDVPQGLNDWAEFDLSTPIWVTGDETIWIVWQAEQPLSPWHMGVCSDIDPSGNGIWAWNGTQWDQIWFSTGDWMVKTYFNWDEPQAQDVYVSGNHFTTGKVYKNNSLLYSITDSIDIQLKGIQVAEDGTVYGAGYAYNGSDIHGCVWMNDSCIFTADTNTYFDHIVLNGNNWTVAGGNNVWQNGELLYSYSHGDDECHIHSLTVDTTTGDIYAGGAIYPDEYLTHACVWKNDSLIWIEDSVSSVENICFDGENLYSAGYKIENDSLSYGVIWQNDSIIYQLENANFGQIATFDGSLYWSGISLTDTVVYIWQDGEVLYALPELSGISNLVVNESGVYYTDAQTVYKDGEVLYQPEEWCIITDLVVKPAPTPPEYTITVESDNPEWGSVSGGGTYYYGDTIQIEAFPNTGYSFIHWDDDNTSNPRTVVVTEDHTYTAYFELRQCLVQTMVIPEGTGIISGGGAHYYGDTIQLTATAYTGYAFDQWEDGITDNSREVLVTSDTTFTALFTPLQYEVTAACSPVEGGTVEGTGFYDYNTWAVLTAVPNEGYIFLCWSDGIVRNPREILVTQDTYMRAMFYHNATPTYTITVVSNDILLGEVSGSGEYPEGSTIEISATPAANAVFRSWDDGNTDNPRSITVTQDMTYTAIFETIPQTSYHLIVVSSNALMGSVSGGGTFPANTTTTISATPNNGFLFTGWQDGNTDNPRSVIILSDTLFTAYFAIEPVQTYTITVQYDEYQGYVMGAGTYNAGATARLAAIPNDNYYFVKWGDGVTDNPRDILVDHDIILAAFFNGTGVDEYEGQSIKLYPNPANDIIRLEGLEGEREISIFNAFGTCVKSVTLNGDDEIRIVDLTKGLYLLRINGKLTTKFVKQ